jgi:hypothetical protein
MPGELLWVRRDGKEYRKGDLVRLEHDEDFATWNDLWTERHGVVVGTIVYEGLEPLKDTLAEVLVDGRVVAFEWEDLEVDL